MKAATYTFKRNDVMVFCSNLIHRAFGSDDPCSILDDFEHQSSHLSSNRRSYGSGSAVSAHMSRSSSSKQSSNQPICSCMFSSSCSGVSLPLLQGVHFSCAMTRRM